ncbi:hypothetical protein BH24DEI1_BH24DEI1_18550 [soil metagenome]|jgi:hypothetical protein|nr:hypothetical protein [Deinococcota bacterium]
MSTVVKRSLWLIVISTAVVVVALTFGQPGGGMHTGEGHEGTAMTDHATHADLDSE